MTSGALAEFLFVTIIALVACTQDGLAVVLDERAPVKVWIDTDAACGETSRVDVDDCWALIQAFRSPAIVVRGVSTVFGNTDEQTAFRITSELVRRFGRREDGTRPIVRRGAREGLEDGATLTPAATELADILLNERLTVVALGPVTNIALLLQRFPDRAGAIERIVAIAGMRRGDGTLSTDSYPLVHFHDQNLQMDPHAMEIVLRSQVPVVLTPFEAARQVSIDSADLDRLARAGESGRFLARFSRPWLASWQRWIGGNGFHPFDTLAIGVIAWPSLFQCSPMTATVERHDAPFVPRYRDQLRIEAAGGRDGAVLYCWGVAPAFKERLLATVGAY